jgi:hypothetical protein
MIYKKELKELMRLNLDFKVFGLDLRTMTTYSNTIEAFSAAIQKAFPNTDGWQTMTVYEAAKLLKGFLVLNSLKKYVTLGYFRSTNGLVYKEEIEKFREACLLFEEFKKLGLVGKERIQGREFTVLYQGRINTLGIPELSQSLKSLLKITTEEWFQEWVKATDLDN